MVSIKEGSGNTAASKARLTSRHMNGCRRLAYCMGGLLRTLFPALVVIIFIMFNDAKNGNSNNMITSGAQPTIQGQSNLQLPAGDPPLVDTDIKQLPVSSFIRKFSGTEWEVWNSTSPGPINKVNNLTCDWVTFRAGGGGKEGAVRESSDMCVHPGHEFVSNQIRAHGSWQDCTPLTSLWHEHYRDGGIYIEIGANIGSCIMQMLLTTNATILAFEPNPRNQFCLTSTLSKMAEKYRNRFTLFPIALGNKEASSTINAPLNNMGNSVVGKQIKDFVRQEFSEAIPIRVERLDDVLDIVGDRHVPLMKLDAQGFECFIIDGMGSVLKKTQIVKAEIANKWLKRFEGCSDTIMLEKLRSHNYKVYRKNVLISKGDPIRKGTIFDIVAKKQG
jgi:FkbM family methyltransferase